MAGHKFVQIVIQGIRMDKSNGWTQVCPSDTSKSDCWTQVCPNSDTSDNG